MTILKLKPGQLEARFITMSRGGPHTSTRLEHKALYRVDEAWGGGAILHKCEPRSTKLKTLPCSEEVFKLFRKHKKFGKETIQEGIERLINEAENVR